MEKFDQRVFSENDSLNSEKVKNDKLFNKLLEANKTIDILAADKIKIETQNQKLKEILFKGQMESMHQEVENQVLSQKYDFEIQEKQAMQKENKKLNEEIVKGRKESMQQKIENQTLSKKYNTVVQENYKKDIQIQSAEKILIAKKIEEENMKKRFQFLNSEDKKNKQNFTKFIPFLRLNSFLPRTFFDFPVFTPQINTKEDKNIEEEIDFENKEKEEPAEIQEKDIENIIIDNIKKGFSKAMNFTKKTKQTHPSSFGFYITKEINNEKFLFRTIREGEEEIQIKITKCYENLLQSKNIRANINKLEYDPFIIEIVESSDELKTFYYQKIFNASHCLRDFINAFKQKGVKIPLSKIIEFSKKLFSILSFLEDYEIFPNTLLPEHILLGGNNENKEEDLCLVETILKEDINIIMLCESRSLKELEQMKKYASPEFYEIIMSYQRELQSEDPNFDHFKDKTNHMSFVKSQFFSLGLILLELGLQRVTKYKYDPELSIELDYMINEFQERYKFDAENENIQEIFETLIKIMKKLLAFDQEKRNIKFVDAENLFAQVTMTIEQKLKNRLASNGYAIE